MAEFTASDGTRLYYTDEGEGLPVLCLSGLTRNGGDFDYLAARILPDVRLIRPDYRGRGKSQWTGGASYTVPREAKDAVELLNHLGVDKAAVIGTSRGGLIGLVLAVTAKARLRGVCFNDVGPVLERAGIDKISGYVGRNPVWKTVEEAVAALPQVMTGFANVPPSRWAEDVARHYDPTPEGLKINYDPELRESFLKAFEGPDPDLWPLFDALAGLPVALLRGANSDLLSQAAADEMLRRRPDMFFANVPDRAHIPFLDEPESLTVIRDFLKACA